jgi:hypothetical protein
MCAHVAFYMSAHVHIESAGKGQINEEASHHADCLAAAVRDFLVRETWLCCDASLPFVSPVKFRDNELLLRVNATAPFSIASMM